jgi:hypothetical protein
MTMGRVIPIARRSVRRAPMQEMATASISCSAGLEADVRSAKCPRREITLLEREASEDARFKTWGRARRRRTAVDGPPSQSAGGGREPAARRGGIIALGSVRLEVAAHTYPCERMREVHDGLRAALAKHWRGGVTCRVHQGGTIADGDPIEVLWRPPETEPRLAG